MGSRHLQGLAKLSEPTTIDIFDPKRSALDLCIERFNETVHPELALHNVRCHTSANTLLGAYDLGINATTSGPRLESLKLTAHRANCWILEKILSQNSSDLDEMLMLTKDCEKVWVNYMMRELKWLQDFKFAMDSEKLHSIELDGLDWSLACNIIHHLDFAVWISDANLLKLYTGNLDKNWFKSKRSGYYEICGEVIAHFSNGMRARFASRSDGPARLTKIKTDRNIWVLDEISAKISLEGKTIFSGSFERQSSLTTKLVQDFLNGKNLRLPTLTEAASTHKIFIEEFLSHWRQTVDPNASRVPIT